MFCQSRWRSVCSKRLFVFCHWLARKMPVKRRIRNSKKTTTTQTEICHLIFLFKFQNNTVCSTMHDMLFLTKHNSIKRNPVDILQLLSCFVSSRRTKTKWLQNKDYKTKRIKRSSSRPAKRIHFFNQCLGCNCSSLLLLHLHRSRLCRPTYSEE